MISFHFDFIYDSFSIDDDIFVFMRNSVFLNFNFCFVFKKKIRKKLHENIWLNVNVL